MASAALAVCQLPSTVGSVSLTRTSALRSAVTRPALARAAPLRLVTRAAVATDGEAAQPSAAIETPADFGKGGNGSWFGFGPRQELNVGRLAMMGFASALVMEVVTGKGILGQLGLDHPQVIQTPFLLGLAFLTVGGLLGGYTVINNPPDFSKAPANAGEGLPRNPFDASELDRLPTYTRGGAEPYASDLPADK